MAERTPKQNAIHKADVKVGSTYAVKVSGRIVPVTIVQGRWSLNEHKGWDGRNLQTGKLVRIRSAAKLRYELTRGWLGPLKHGWHQGWVRKDSPIVFELLDHRPLIVAGLPVEPMTDSAPELPPGAYYDKGRVLRDWSRDELVRVCGEDAPEQCQEFEDESGRWHRV